MSDDHSTHWDIDWERLLNPAELKANLIIASIYITGFEVLKNSIVDHINNFFVGGLEEEYQQEVLSRHKSPVYASLSWLREMCAIDDNDLATFEKVKEWRNYLAHEMAKFVTTGETSDCIQRLGDMFELTKKIGVWWITNFELPVIADIDPEEIDEEAILPGPVVMLRLMIQIALGAEEEAAFYYNEFAKRTREDT